MLNSKRSILLLAFLASAVNAFVPLASRFNNPQQTLTTLSLRIPSFGTNDDEKKEGESQEEDKKIGMMGFVQLLTAGLGAPFLGDYQGYDKETNSFMFSLEANNFVDEKGNSKQTQMPYFEEGWVDPADLEKSKEGFKFPWQK